MPTSHRSGGLKQSNKGHKTSKSSKRSLARGLGAGRIEKAKKTISKSRKDTSVTSARQNRVNEASMRRKSKKEVSFNKRRIGSTASETTGEIEKQEEGGMRRQ